MKIRPPILGGTVFLALTATLVMAAQTDFSGTWLLDKSKSDTQQLGQGRLNRAGNARRSDVDLSAAEQKLIVSQTDAEITVERMVLMGAQERGLRQTFRLDGTQTTNQAAGRQGELKSKAKWKGNVLVIDGTQKVNSQRGQSEMSLKEEWSLSDDGKVLTIKTTRSTARGRARTTTQVYNKQ